MNPLTFRKLIFAKRFIAKNYNKGFSLEEISYQVGLSKFHLSRKFKKTFGETMYQFHTRIRISKATKWIDRKDLEISEIAWRLGFPDLSTFSKFFKKDLIVSPRKFKKYFNKDDVKFIGELTWNARKSVFATFYGCDLTFQKSANKEYLLQPENNKVLVSLVYIFNDQAQLEEDQLDFLNNLKESGASVLLLFLNDIETGLGSAVSENFVTIDGKVAGTFEYQDANSKSGYHWFFKNPSILKQLSELRSEIEKEGIPLDDYLQRMPKKFSVES